MVGGKSDSNQHGDGYALNMENKINNYSRFSHLIGLEMNRDLNPSILYRGDISVRSRISDVVELPAHRTIT